MINIQILIVASLTLLTIVSLVVAGFIWLVQGMSPIKTLMVPVIGTLMTASIRWTIGLIRDWKIFLSGRDHG